MKILHLSDSVFTNTGFSTVSLEMLNGLAKKDYECHMLCHNYIGQDLTAGNVKLKDGTPFNFNIYGSGRLPYCQDLIMPKIRELKPDIFSVLLDTFMVMSPTPWFLDLDFAPALSCFYYPSDGEGGLPNGCEAVLRKVHLPVAMSKFAQNQVKEEYGIETCYDDKTEILTNEGWKFFKDLNKTENVAILNNKGYLDWKKPIKYQKYRFKGKLLHWIGRGYDIKVTSEHNILIRTRNDRIKDKNKFIFKKAKYLKDKIQFEFKRDTKWRGKEQKYFFLPQIELDKNKIKDGRFKTKNKKKFLMKDWIKFLAWYLSEGCCDGNYRVVIAQENKKYRNEIKELIINMSYIYNDNGQRIGISSKQLVSYLKQFGKSKDKFIPKFIKELSLKYLKLFIQTYCKGDGSFFKTKVKCIATISKKMSDDLMEIIFKTGLVSSITTSTQNRKNILYIINISHKQQTPIIWRKPKLEYYDGFVYDVTVSGHKLYVRRNGKAIWSGNSYIPHGVDINNFYKVSDEEKEKIRIKWGLQNKFVIGTVTRNQTRKMLDKTVETASKICKKYQNIIFFMHTDPFDAASLFDIIKLIGRYQLQNRFIFSGVKYHSGFSYKQLNEIYNLMDLFILTTSGEGFGIPIIEAMSCQVPVIATDYTTPKELIIDDGKCGEVAKLKTAITGSWNVDRGIIDVDDCVEKIEKLYKDEKLREEYGKVGRRKVENKYQWSLIIDSWDKLFKKSLGGN